MESTDTSATTHPKRLLLVEDDDALANVYLNRLEAEGFEVRRVDNGEDALAAALNFKPIVTNALELLCDKTDSL